MKLKGYRHPRDIILQSVQWYLRYSLSYRDLEEMLKERGGIRRPHVDFPLGAPLRA